MLSLFLAATLHSTPGEAQTDWVKKPHALTIAGQKLKYETVAGRMPIRNTKSGDIEGRIFFTYYHRTDLAPGTKRPVTFVFNGGPGSASVWMHLGFVGPKRPKMGSIEGFMPPPPYELVTNAESILPESDIVTIDPVGTGYSRANKTEDGPKFWGVEGDISSVGEFIKSFLTSENRWLSPIFVMGESYGGIRGSGLASWLHGRGIGLSGLILVSPLIGPPAADPIKPNDGRSAYYFPTFATTGWYFHKLSPELQAKPLSEVYDLAFKFARDEYLPALPTLDKLTPDQRKDLVKKLHDFTGMDTDAIDKANLRIPDFRWHRDLLKDERNYTGRYDARYVGIDNSPGSPRGGGEDPSYTQVQPVFTSTVNDYLAGEIGYETTLRYYILGEGINAPWKYPDGNGPLDESDSLKRALAYNPYTKVMVCMGYYDVACPMGTNDALLDRLNMDPRLKDNVVRKRYATGHMIYMDARCRKQLHDDVATFIKAQSHPTAPAGSFKRP